jgi:hypothetical protein
MNRKCRVRQLLPQQLSQQLQQLVSWQSGVMAAHLQPLLHLPYAVAAGFAALPPSQRPAGSTEPVLVAEQVCHPALLMFCAVTLQQSATGLKRN